MGERGRLIVCFGCKEWFCKEPWGTCREKHCPIGLSCPDAVEDDLGGGDEDEDEEEEEEGTGGGRGRGA